MGHLVFISYSHKDKDYAHQLRNQLTDHGIVSWLDDNINYGSLWQETIEKKIIECDAFIIVMSPNAQDPNCWVKEELQVAKKHKKPIYPLWLDGEIWFGLGTIQCVDVRGGKMPSEQFFVSLLNVILESSEDKTSKVSINVTGNVQGNIVVGNNNTATTSVTDERNATGSKSLEPPVRAIRKRKDGEKNRKATLNPARLPNQTKSPDQIDAHKNEAQGVVIVPKVRLVQEGPVVGSLKYSPEVEKERRIAIWSLYSVFIIFFIATFGFGNFLEIGNFETDKSTLGLRLGFVFVSLTLVLVTRSFTKTSAAWQLGSRKLWWMFIGTIIYAVFSWLFNGTVFVAPSLSQVTLRPAIVIPIFFGYTFGPVVGFFSGAVGNMFGDALTGYGLSPQWSAGYGLIGFVSGLWMLFEDRKQRMNTVLWVGGALTALAAIVFFLNRNQPNMMFYDAANNIFGDAQISPLAGLSILIGFLLVLGVRFFFGSNEDLAAAVTWGMLGNIIGIGFAALSDIWINGFSLAAAMVGEFLPAAGPNMIFAAILVPPLVLAYVSVRRQPTP